MTAFSRPPFYTKTTFFYFQALAANTDPAGDHFAGAIWLSYRRYPGFGTSGNTIGVPYDLWMGRLLTPVRDNIQMWFAHGSKDDKGGHKDATYMYNTVLNADRKRDKLPLTSSIPIDGTALRGVALLGKKELPTDELIEKFIEKAVKMRPNQSQKKRNASEYKPQFIDPAALGFR